MPQKTAKLRLCNCKFALSIFGICFGIFGLIWGMLWEDIFKTMMQREMILHPDSRVFESWKKPPIPLSLDIYFFNWTNPEDFQDFSTKPILQQLGPYRFTEKPDKVDIIWHPSNFSVSYRKKSDFYFDVNGSRGSLDDQITTLNAVALTAAATAKQWDIIRKNLVDMGLKVYNQEISVTKTADELLFSGYSDDMIDMARAAPIFGSDVQVPFDRFGWFYTRNGSADLTGTFTITTGADDISKIGQMHSWNFKTNTGYYESYCGMTNGSAGEFYPPNLSVNGSISMFSPDMCRSIPLDYVGSEQVEGLTGYKFAGGLRSVDNGTIYPDTKCFCGGKCVPSGVMNISACRFGSPVFMSYPHFFNADPMYANQVVGLSPNQNDHEFFVVLEPKTAIALDVAARFQLNMFIEPISGISLYENVPTIFFPLIWFEQKARITPELAGELKVIPKYITAGQILGGICFAIGLIVLCWYPSERILHQLRGGCKMSHNIQQTSRSNKNRKDGEITANSCTKEDFEEKKAPLLEKLDQNSKV